MALLGDDPRLGARRPNDDGLGHVHVLGQRAVWLRVQARRRSVRAVQLPEAAHRSYTGGPFVRVRAIDAAGNIDAAPTVHRWTIRPCPWPAGGRRQPRRSSLLCRRAGDVAAAPPVASGSARVDYNVQLFRGSVKVLKPGRQPHGFSCARAGPTSAARDGLRRARIDGTSGRDRRRRSDAMDSHGGSTFKVVSRGRR